MGAVAVLRRGHLHRRQQPGVQGPARAHRRAGCGTQQRTGWHLLPVQVGPQASCSGYADRMSSDLATAKQQGSAEAATAIGTARGLGIGPWEHALLRPRGLRPRARRLPPGRAELPLRLDRGAARRRLPVRRLLQHRRRHHLARPRGPGVARRPTRCPTTSGSPGPTAGRTRSPTTGSSSDRWDDHARVHQYALDVPQTYGGYTLTDRRQLGRRGQGLGRVAVAAAVSWRRRGPAQVPDAAPRLARSRGRGGAVRAAQAAPPEAANPSGRYDAQTVAAVRRRSGSWTRSRPGKVTRRTWVALLARGAQPLLKVGSTGDPVRRLQRALTAALGKRVKVDGAVLAGHREGGAGLPAEGRTPRDGRRDRRGVGAG